MIMKTRPRVRVAVSLFAVLLGAWLGLGTFVGEAHAIIGMPLTPMSYAGVARRTTRRAAYVGMATGSPYYW
jgi:hypothetical protein